MIGTARNSIAESAQPAILSAPQHSEPVPVPQAPKNATSKEDVAPALNTNATVKQNSPVAAPEPSELPVGQVAPSVTANQMVALVQPAPGVLNTGSTSVDTTTVAKSNAATKATSNDATTNTINAVPGPKQHAPAASNQAGSQAGSQSASQQPASSDDQTQGPASQQGQNAAPFHLSFANQPVASIDHTTNSATTPPAQPAASLPGTAHPAKTPDSGAPVPAALPQAPPAVNTARLIQSIGQSEMRVGMRSNEFGNISINTSATRDLISAQISLDHGELARTLATHLPEMQARLGGNQAVDVRIDMNGQAAGQGAGTSAGMSQNAADQSSSRQQRGSAGSGNSANGFSEPGRTVSVAATPAAESRLSTRLDIRA